MRLGIAIPETDPWGFFQDIYENLVTNYDVDIFEFQHLSFPFFTERINRHLFNRKIKTFLKTHDIVFFEWASDLLAAATQYPKECKIVTRLHRYELFEWAPRINWEHVDKVILVSHAMLRKFSEKFPEHRQKAIFIPEGISTTKFQPSTKKYTGDIGTLCHLTPRKRVYELILAFYELRQVRKDLHLHIAGSNEYFYNDYFDALQSLVKRLNLEDNVSFYGSITESWKWYPKIDIFISNSYSEGLQVAPMEAMASGCYCLSHHWDGAEDLLPEDNLFLTNAELIRKIIAYSELPDSVKKEVKMNMRIIAVERFDIDKVKSSIRTVIDNLS